MAFCLWLMVLFSFWKTLFNSPFHLMSPARSHFCSMFFGNVYSFEIFSIGNSAETREKEKLHGNWAILWSQDGPCVPITSGGLENIWRTSLMYKLMNTLHRLLAAVLSYTPIPFPVLKTGKGEIAYAKCLSHRVTWKVNGKFRNLTQMPIFRNFYLTLVYLKWHWT